MLVFIIALHKFSFRAPEPLIIEYQAQQNKLFPPLAATFAFHFAAKQLMALYRSATVDIGIGDLRQLPDVFFPKVKMVILYSCNLFE